MRRFSDHTEAGHTPVIVIVFTLTYLHYSYRASSQFVCLEVYMQRHYQPNHLWLLAYPLACQSEDITWLGHFEFISDT